MLSISSWGPFKVGARGNLPPPPAPRPLSAALIECENFLHKIRIQIIIISEAGEGFLVLK
jgi:hypothetical protein